MALFKIFKGNSNKLGAAPTAGEQDTRAAHEGFAYFTPDDGKFYIDIADADNAIIGTNRIPLNAMCADTLKSINIHSTSPATNLDDLKDVQNQKFTSYFAGGSNTVINNPFGNGVAFGLTVYRVATGFIMQDITSAGGVRLTRYWDNTNKVWTAWRHIIISPDEGQGSTSLPIYIDSNGRTQSITSYEGNAASATKAIQDGNGNIITSTYLPLTGGIISGNLSLTGELNVTGNTYLHNQTTIDSLTAGSLIVNGNSSFVNDVSFTKIPTAPTAAAGTNNTQLATTEFVTGAVTGLAGPMRFIGTLGTGGTITTLPTAAESNKGWTYKVITKGTYGSAYAEVGDLFISNGLSWINIPSGDVSDGTVTNIATGGGLTGGPITNSGTISHADTSTQESITASANERTYITGVTLDDYGHVTALDTGTETVVNTDTKVNVVTRGTTKAYLLADTTEPTSTAAAHSAVAETGVYLDITEATLVATTFKGALTGNADTATQVKVTSTSLPSSGNKAYYLAYTESTDTGNQDLKNSARAYIYETTSQTDICAGVSGKKGTLTLWNGSYYANLSPGTLTASHNITLPDKAGTVALVADITKTQVGLSNVTNHAQIPKSIGTTKGDIIYWSAASTPARLGIGSVGQVLKVSSDGVPVWSSDNNSLNWGQITQSGANNIDEGLADFTDNTEIFSSYASNNGFADTNATGRVYRRDAVKMYNYIKTKLAVANNNVSVGWDTETTIATIGGTAIKIKIPVNPNTDYTVRQTNDTSDTNYRVLLSYAANNDQVDNITHKSGNLIYNPSANQLSTGNLQLTGELDVTGNAYLRNQTTADSLTAGSLIVNGSANFVQSPTAPTPAAASNDTSVATTAYVTSAINALDGTISGSPGAGKTLTAFSQTDGKISATFDNISITKSQVSDFSHTHGNISNDGKITATQAIASGDKIVIVDSSDSSKLTGTTITFDGSTATKALTQKGTWETFNNYSHPTATAYPSGLYKITTNNLGHVTAATAVTASDITGLNIYWANMKTTSAATYKAQPEVASVKVNGKTASGDADSASTKNVQLIYDASLEVLNFVFS